MSLKSDLLDLFDNMRTDPTNYDDTTFYTTIASLIKNYVSMLSLDSSSVVGTDTSPSGAFTGSVSGGTLTISSSQIKAKLKACVEKQNPYMTDDDLAEAFADGLDADTVTFTCTISGQTVTTTSPPQTIPSQDSGVVTCTFSSSSLEQALKDLFEEQKENYEDASDEDFADTLASEVKKYYTQPVSCTVVGSSHLAGCVGTCIISE